MIYQGNGVSKGIAIGEIYLYEAFIPHVEEAYYDGGEPQCHLERYDRLCAAADKELKEICERDVYKRQPLQNQQQDMYPEGRTA